MKPQNKQEKKPDFSYKETLNLLKTDFSMRANSVLREPEIQDFWAKNNFSKIREALNLGVENFAKPLNFFNFDKNNQNMSPKKWVRNDKNDNIKV